MPKLGWLHWKLQNPVSRWHLHTIDKLVIAFDCELSWDCGPETFIVPSLGGSLPEEEVRHTSNLSMGHTFGISDNGALQTGSKGEKWMQA